KGLIKKNFSYIISGSLLLVFYIGNRYKCEDQLTSIAQLERQITDLRYESITTSAELMSVSRQSEVSRLVKDRGLNLEESIKAPQRIFIEN
ncbi:MAG: FtsL-like putative cell division protein, partial [Bacteroidales bacterium]|nr:FtsL-like putative cell division protein [Bacteroidales bacterium]